MKKVLFYFRGIYNGGTEMESYTLLTKLKDSYDVYFTYYDEENSDKITIAKMESVAKYIPFNSKATFDTIVFCTQARREIEKIKEKFEYNSAYFWYHYYSENQNAFLEMALNGACDKVIAVSKTSKKKLENLDFAKGKEDRIVVINNIVDVDKIKAIADEEIDYSNTHPGYIKLIDGDKDLIVVTQPSKEELEYAKSKNVELDVIPVVNEGFVFYVNNENPVDVYKICF